MRQFKFVLFFPSFLICVNQALNSNGSVGLDVDATDDDEENADDLLYG